MANTFELIASSTVGAGGASSIDFTSIPATFTDLVVKLSGRSTYSGGGVADYAVIGFNGVTTNQTMKYLYGTGSAAGSFSDTTIYAPTSTNAQKSVRNQPPTILCKTSCSVCAFRVRHATKHMQSTPK